MAFKLSQRSLDNLEGVDDALQAVCKMAISSTLVDFGVICGMRTEAMQKELFAKGASQCDGVKKKSKHQLGLAVDCMAYLSGRASWELKVYDEIADAMADACNQVGVRCRWGAAWHIHDIGAWAKSGRKDVVKPNKLPSKVIIVRPYRS